MTYPVIEDLGLRAGEKGCPVSPSAAQIEIMQERQRANAELLELRERCARLTAETEYQAKRIDVLVTNKGYFPAGGGP
jgi:hypothetical protein